MSVRVVGCCRCCPGGVLTAEGGPGHSWRRFPCASLAGGLALAPSVSLLPMVSYRVVSPWWLSWTLRVAVGGVALSVVPSVMPVVRSLRALLWFTASLMLLMLVVVGVGLYVGCQWLLLLLVVVLGAGRWVARLERLGRLKVSMHARSWINADPLAIFPLEKKEPKKGKNYYSNGS